MSPQRLFLSIFFMLIVLLLMHHYIEHDGIAFEEKDFKRGMLNLLNSHEGIILLIILIGVGVSIGFAF